MTPKAVTHRILVTSDMGIGGVATSGLGGRSLTRGIASGATVLAADAACADAAATALANATYVPCAAVIRKTAESIYPDTDLTGLEVTISVGDLSPGECDKALEQAISKGEEMVKRGTIWGASLTVKGCTRATGGMADLLESLNK